MARKLVLAFTGLGAASAVATCAQATLSAFLGEDLGAPPAVAHWEQFLLDAVRRTVAPAP